MKSMVKIEGIERLMKKIQKLGSELNNEIEGALTKGAVLIKNDAVEKLRPYIFKSMGGRKAIHIEKISNQDKVKDVSIKVDPDYILYSPRGGETKLKWVEFGKPGYVPHPFLRKALDENKEKVLKVIKDDLKQVIDRAGQ